jgi:transcriptional regulator with PAS, ATPase and Fis domain
MIVGKYWYIVNSEEMYELADRLSRKTFKKAKVILSHSYEDSIMWAHKLEREGYQILISRGGHGERIRASGVNLPVIDIPVSSINVMSPFVHAIRKGGKIAVIGNQYLLDLAKDLAKDFNCDILCYHVDTFGDFERYVASAKAAGAVSVIGGYHAVYFAEAAGLNSFCVEMRELEFEVAMEEALKVQKILEEEKRWNELFRTILDSIQDGVISVNNTGAITHINSRAQINTGHGQAGMPSGMEIKEPSIQKKPGFVLREGKIAKNEWMRKPFTNISPVIKPITVDKETVGGVVILQEVKSIQKMERQIREQLFNRGLVAQNRFEDILGTSKILREAIEKAKQYSLVDSTILICGESGTGKEIFAQSIHNNSLRSKEAFVAINCAAISQNLLESELFGYVDGAFTGAKRGGKIGLFEVAHNGTIFLDEIGETSLDMQTRLLRVLEERRIRRIGDDKVIPVNYPHYCCHQ